MNKLLIIVAAIFFCSDSFAAKTYTPSELNKMINSGQYPDQGSVTTTSKPMTFAECKRTVDGIISQIRDSYPVKSIVDTSILYIVKAWTNDAAVTVNCSGPDKKMVLTQVPYK